MATTESYRRVDPETFKRKNEEAKSRSTSSYWKLKVGPVGKPTRNVIRLMPAHLAMPDPDPIIEGMVHFSLGPQMDTGSPCRNFYDAKGVPAHRDGAGPALADCPVEPWVAAIREKAANESDPNKKKQMLDIAQKVKAGWRFFANIVDQSRPQDGVQVWGFSNDIEKRLRACFFDDDGNFRDITDPEHGRDVIIEAVKRKPDPQGREFNDYPTFRVKENESKLSDMACLEELHDLTEYVIMPTVEQVLGAMRGVRIERRQGALPEAPPQVTLPPVGAPATAPRNVTPPPPPVAPPPAAAPPTGKRATAGRRAATAAAPAAPAGPWAAARALVAQHGLTSGPGFEIKPEEVSQFEKPPCFERETEFTDATCQQCPLLLPCTTVVHKLVA